MKHSFLDEGCGPYSGAVPYILKSRLARDALWRTVLTSSASHERDRAELPQVLQL